jgi:ADP-ribose pyrophosphatase YjhB (NUDIX family)
MGDRRYPEHPLVGVGGVVFDPGGRVLLIRRGGELLKGLWSVPGGMLDVGETLADGVRREVLEETGILVAVGPLITTFDRILRDEDGAVQYHYVLVDYLCEAPPGSVPRAASDAAEALFVDPGRLAEYRTTPSLPWVIELALAMREGRRT